MRAVPKERKEKCFPKGSSVNAPRLLRQTTEQGTFFQTKQPGIDLSVRHIVVGLSNYCTMPLRFKMSFSGPMTANLLHTEDNLSKTLIYLYCKMSSAQLRSRLTEEY